MAVAPPGLPSHVRRVAAAGPIRLPDLPKLNSHESMRLIADLRRSELRKARALRDAVQHSDRVRASYGGAKARKPRTTKGKPLV